MSSSFLGKIYTLVKSENFDEYMTALGVGLILRKMGNTVSSQCLLTKNEDNIHTFWLKTSYHCCKTSFKLNEPFTEVTLDNRVVKTTCSLNGNIFVQEQRKPGLKTTRIVREYRKNGELITTLFVEDVKAVRYYVGTKETARTLDDISEKQLKSTADQKRKKSIQKYPSKANTLVPSPSVKCMMTVGNKAETTKGLKPKEIVKEYPKKINEKIIVTPATDSRHEEKLKSVSLQKEPTSKLKPTEEVQMCPKIGDVLKEDKCQKPYIDPQKYPGEKPPKKKCCCISV